MEPSKRYSFISLLFILKCLSKTLVIKKDGTKIVNRSEETVRLENRFRIRPR